jgi:type IV secretory pathway component VirB8
MHILGDEVIEPFEYINDPSPIWWVLGIVGVVAAVTAVAIVLLVRKKKKEDK